MPRVLVGVLTPAAVLTVSVAGALGAPSTTAKLGQASVTVADCHPSDSVDQRYASFSGQMRAIPGTRRMIMRFTLLERLGGSLMPFKAVPLPDLQAWRRSKPGARTFIYTQRVTALRDGGAYRMRVQFRWYGDRHTLLRTAIVRSRTCRQPTPLPDLTISSITSSPAADGGQRNYSITVANVGQGEARDVPVILKVDGTMVGSAHVDLLPGQESSMVQIPGPSCAFTVRAVADPDRLIRETDDSDNALTVPCAQAIS
jgi:hypothetical protein